MYSFISNWLPVIGYCALIFLQSSVPTVAQMPRFPFSDKLLHFIAYGIMAALFCRAFSSHDRLRRRRGLLFLFSVIVTTLYGVSDEWHQSYVPGRDATAGDALADFAGSLTGSWLYLRYLSQGLRSHTPWMGRGFKNRPKNGPPH